MNSFFMFKQCPIKSVVVSEKSFVLRSAYNQLVVKCGVDCNKFQIAAWIKGIFEASPKKISVMRCRGKLVNNKKTKGSRPDYKKAIITFDRDIDIEKMVSFNKN